MTESTVTERPSDYAALVARHIHLEANQSFQRGALNALLLGITGAVGIAGAGLLGWMTHWGLPCIFAAACGISSGLLLGLARMERLDRGLAPWIFIPFTSLPTLFFLYCHFALPSGAATYITGPFSYLYFLLVAWTAFLFNPRLSVACGLVAGAGWALCLVLAFPHLQKIEISDTIFKEDLANGFVLFNKPLMLAFLGFAVGGLAQMSRRLVFGVLEEQQEKNIISRLFGQYVSPAVKEKIIDQKSSVTGERQLVAVLFSDIRGFSSYSENVDPAEVVAHLNEYFDAMVGAITEHGGVVDKFIGDAVMAVFGGLMEMENPSESAVKAAISMRTRLAALNRQWADLGMTPFNNGIGIHLGEVIQGPLGSATRKEFTVIGDAVNIAARLEGMSKSLAHAIVFSDEVKECLTGTVKEGCTSLGTHLVKGRKEKVKIWGLESLSGADLDDPSLA